MRECLFLLLQPNFVNVLTTFEVLVEVVRAVKLLLASRTLERTLILLEINALRALFPFAMLLELLRSAADEPAQVALDSLDLLLLLDPRVGDALDVAGRRLVDDLNATIR